MESVQLSVASTESVSGKESTLEKEESSKAEYEVISVEAEDEKASLEAQAGLLSSAITIYSSSRALGRLDCWCNWGLLVVP